SSARVRLLALYLTLGIAGRAAAQFDPPQPAQALPPASEDDARALFERGSALYALGRYAEAAPLFERAFELKPDPALLYNAAQAYRLLGNKPRALTLYQNYFRLFGDQIPNAPEVHPQTD